MFLQRQGGVLAENVANMGTLACLDSLYTTVRVLSTIRVVRPALLQIVRTRMGLMYYGVRILRSTNA